MLAIALSWLQAQSGTSFSVFDDTTIELPHLEGLWFLSVRQFMSLYNITFKLHDTCVPAVQRENDIHIMDHIIKHQSDYKQSRIKIKRINYCRLYLQALTISDITDAAGKHID